MEKIHYDEIIALEKERPELSTLDFFCLGLLSGYLPNLHFDYIFKCLAPVLCSPKRSTYTPEQEIQVLARAFNKVLAKRPSKISILKSKEDQLPINFQSSLAKIKNILSQFPDMKNHDAFYFGLFFKLDPNADLKTVIAETYMTKTLSHEIDLETHVSFLVLILRKKLSGYRSSKGEKNDTNGSINSLDETSASVNEKSSRRPSLFNDQVHTTTSVVLQEAEPCVIEDIIGVEEPLRTVKQMKQISFMPDNDSCDLDFPDCELRDQRKISNCYILERFFHF